MTVLSRKPNQSNSPARQSTSNATAGMENLNLNDYEDDSGEEASTQPTMTPEERRAKIQREREEKQKKYDEARGRLFGTNGAGSGASTPGSTTPPRDSSANKGKAKGKANGGQDRTRPSSAGKGKQLYDPNYTPKPDSKYVQKQDKEKKEGNEDEEEGMVQPVRQPYGPDGTGGFQRIRGNRLPQ
jgi:hypothetical protein